MSIKKGPAFWTIAAALTLSTSLFAAGQGQSDKDKPGPRNQDRQQQQQQQKQAPAPQGVGPSPQSKDEYDAFLALQSEQAPARKVEMAEAFVAKYPNSDFTSYAHTFRVGAYGQLGKPKEAIEAAKQAIDTTIKFGEKLV